MHYKVWNIYFVQMIGSDWIKIGKTSKQKSEEIITSLKLPVNVIKIVLGTGELLKTLKAEFESHCVKTMMVGIILSPNC